LNKNLHYLAVMSALTLPDICSALENPDGRAHHSRYESWWETWKSSDYHFTGEELYMLRCGMLHQGRSGHSDLQYDRIVFMIRPGFHLCLSINTDKTGREEMVLQLDANIFCRDMIASVRSWYETKKDDANVKKWLPFVLTFRPQGLPPHFVGMPVIG